MKDYRECRDCTGSGKLIGPIQDPTPIKCYYCDGTGLVETYASRQQRLDEQEAIERDQDVEADTELGAQYSK